MRWLGDQYRNVENALGLIMMCTTVRRSKQSHIMPAQYVHLCLQL